MAGSRTVGRRTPSSPNLSRRFPLTVKRGQLEVHSVDLESRLLAIMASMEFKAMRRRGLCPYCGCADYDSVPLEALACANCLDIVGYED